MYDGLAEGLGDQGWHWLARRHCITVTTSPFGVPSCCCLSVVLSVASPEGAAGGGSL